jgi:large subunit ribosomal protein L13
MDRKTQTIDATKKPLGRLATEIAVLLMGKNEETYNPSEDKEIYVVVENIDKIAFTGDKEEKKKYYHHSGYPGGLKETPYKKLLEKDRSLALKKAVYGMLPKNRLRKERIKRLKID